MFRPVSMLKLEVLVLEKHLDALTRALGRSGFVHLVPAVAQSPGKLFQGVARSDEIRLLDNRFQQCRELMEWLKLGDAATGLVPVEQRLDTGGAAACSSTIFPATGASQVERIAAVARLVEAESVDLKRFAEEAARLRQVDAFLAAHPALAQVPLGELRTLERLFVLAGRLPMNAKPVLGEGVLVLREGVGTENENRGTRTLSPETTGKRRLTERVTSRQRNGDEMCVVVLGPVAARTAAERELAKAGFKAEVVPEGLVGTGDAERQRITARLATLETLAGERRGRIAEIAQREGTALAEAFSILRQELEMARAQQQFGRSGGMFGVAGWFPATKRESVLALARRATSGTAVVAFTEPHDDELVREGTDKVPVKFKGGALLAPFQEMVAVYGVPRYEEIEPSLFLAVSFLLMFGLMFGDVGQGAVLVAAGAWLLKQQNGKTEERKNGNQQQAEDGRQKAEGKRHKAEGRRQQAEVNAEPQTGGVRVSLCPGVSVREELAENRPMNSRRKAGWLLVMGGSSAMLFGFLYGSVFGNEALIRPLWLSPLHGVKPLFMVAVGLGVAYISLGVVLNIVNRFAARRWFAGVFDKSGVLGLLFYWGCLGLGVKAALTGGVTAAMFALVAGTPVLLLLLTKPLHALVQNRSPKAPASARHRQLSAAIDNAKRKNGKTDDLLAQIFGAGMEVFEMVTGFMGNTVSFVRVGAFALSHATLCLTIYVVGGLVRELPGGGLWWLLVVILGNALVIALEGMIVTIQGLRLQYYEFFSRFFSGDGVAYKPFALEDTGTGDVRGEAALARGKKT